MELIYPFQEVMLVTTFTFTNDPYLQHIQIALSRRLRQLYLRAM